ncbi:MAG TPA: cytochrome b/b6 domain-containing protein [Coleofasciculaceae cyanobacterium]
MARSTRYQPLLLRILHNTTALLILSAIVTGFLVYNTYDGRWGRLPIPKITDSIDIHGTLALCFFLLIPVLALYSFHPGRDRLLQADSFSYLGHLDRPIGWLSWQRLANTGMLLAATCAAISGRMMEEDWLKEGQLGQVWYLIHLTAWLLLITCLVMHLFFLAKVGGSALVRSMLTPRFRSDDSPSRWPAAIKDWFAAQKKKQQSSPLKQEISTQSNPVLRVIEVIVLGGWLVALLAPLLK